MGKKNKTPKPAKWRPSVGMVVEVRPNPAVGYSIPLGGKPGSYPDRWQRLRFGTWESDLFAAGDLLARPDRGGGNAVCFDPATGRVVDMGETLDAAPAKTKPDNAAPGDPLDGAKKGKGKS